MVQFSIRSLLVATAAVATGVAAVRLEASWQGALAMDCLTAFFATFAIVSATQTSGKARTFWIGAAFILGLAAIIASDSAWHSLPFISDGAPSSFKVWYEIQHRLWPFWCAAPINGLLCVATHWLVWPKKTAAENQISK